MTRDERPLLILPKLRTWTPDEELIFWYINNVKRRNFHWFIPTDLRPDFAHVRTFLDLLVK